MKKVIILLFVLICALLAASCECEHTFGEWTETVPAACTADGEKVRVCTECGIEEKEPVAMTGHTLVVDPAVAPTCLAEGLTEGSHCSVCEAVITEQRMVNITGHTIVKTPAVPATCFEEGKSEGSTCSYCGAVFAEPYKTPALGHSYTRVKVLQEATCANSGIKEYTCERCDLGYSERYSLPEKSAEDIYREALSYVGEIIAYDKNGRECGVGTGFLCSGDGRVLTNYHVMRGAYSAKITINGVEYSVSHMLGYDKNIDLAMLQINKKSASVAAVCYETQKAGQTVYTVGSSKGLTNTYSKGIVTYADRELDGVKYVQHDAAISDGNSGSPLLNAYGEVVGVNTMSRTDAQNINFAVSISEIKNLDMSKKMTMAEFYEKEGNAYRILVDAILASGKTIGSVTSCDFTLDEEEFTILYKSDKDEVIVSYQAESDGIVMAFEITINSNPSTFMYSISAAPKNGSADPIVVSGTHESAKYEYAGTLEPSSVKNISRGTEEYESFVAGGSMVISANIIALEYFTYITGIDVNISDLGFVSFVDSLS